MYNTRRKKKFNTLMSWQDNGWDAEILYVISHLYKCLSLILISHFSVFFPSCFPSIELSLTHSTPVAYTSRPSDRHPGHPTKPYRSVGQHKWSYVFNSTFPQYLFSNLIIELCTKILYKFPFSSSAASSESIWIWDRNRNCWHYLASVFSIGWCIDRKPRAELKN